ncbi:MAG: hypothetical protein FJ144_14535 [Deltaproteobacteria bacterium]|nr:hypothetical protein [Deltaproteobacteria bacterium]
MRRVVKRYANRKLYDTTSSRYVALDDVAAFVRRGDEVEVTDNETSEDLTAVTFAQIILEDERKKKSFLSLPVLQELVRYGGDALADVTHRGIEAFGEIREKAERRVSELVPGARGGRKEGGSPAAIIDDMIENSRRRIDDLQKRVDRGLKDSVNKLRSVPGIGPEVERLETGLKEIEGRLRNLLARADRGDARPNRGNSAESEPPGRSSQEGR